jgi:MYXO-CTERM domain-containing protein
MKMGAKFLAAAAVLGLAGFAQAASISVVDKGNPDTTGIGGAVHAEYQVYQFTAAKTTEAKNLNAVDITVVSTSGEIHQIWGETTVFGSKTYTMSPKVGNITDPPQSLADSYFMESKFSLNVVPHNENMTSIVNGANGTVSYSGPPSTIDPEVTGFGFQGGFGSTFEFVGAVPTGSELASYTLYQLVIPDTLAGTITVHIEVTSPTSAIYAAEFVFGGAPPVIPVPAAYPLGLAGLGLLAALRRRHA